MKRIRSIIRRGTTVRWYAIITPFRRLAFHFRVVAKPYFRTCANGNERSLEQRSRVIEVIDEVIC